MTKQLQHARLAKEVSDLKETVQLLKVTNAQMKEQVKALQSANKEHAVEAQVNVELKLKVTELESQVEHYKRANEELVGEVGRLWGMWRGCVVREALRERDDKMREKDREDERERALKDSRPDPPTGPKVYGEYRPYR